MAEADFRDKNVDSFGYLPVASSPQDFAAYLKKDRLQQGDRVRVSGATLD